MEKIRLGIRFLKMPGNNPFVRSESRQFYLGGRPKVDLDTHKHQLTSLYNEDLNINQLVQYNTFTTNTALQLKAVHSRDDLKIGPYGSIQRIQVLFFKVGLDDKEML